MFMLRNTVINKTEENRKAFYIDTLVQVKILQLLPQILISVAPFKHVLFFQPSKRLPTEEENEKHTNAH